jgi:alpha-mannosidase
LAKIHPDELKSVTAVSYLWPLGRAVESAEGCSGNVVVRLYGSRAAGRGPLARPGSGGPGEVAELLERPLRESGLVFELRPFQILMLRLRPE